MNKNSYLLLYHLLRLIRKSSLLEISWSISMTTFLTNPLMSRFRQRQESQHKWFLNISNPPREVVLCLSILDIVLHWIACLTKQQNVRCDSLTLSLIILAPLCNREKSAKLRVALANMRWSVSFSALTNCLARASCHWLSVGSHLKVVPFLAVIFMTSSQSQSSLWLETYGEAFPSCDLGSK